jgi:hypothetical protein
VQDAFDAAEVRDDVIKVSIGCAGALGTSLWVHIRGDRDQVGLAHFFYVEVC